MKLEMERMGCQHKVFYNRFETKIFLFLFNIDYFFNGGILKR